MLLSLEKVSELRKALREALVSSFSNDDSLEMMIEDHLIPTLPLPSANNYPQQVFKLIKAALSAGRLRDLVIGASLDKPGNPELRQFIKAHLLDLIALGPIAFSDNDLLASLVNILLSITDFTGIVLSACMNTLPDLEISADNPREKLFNNDLSSEFKWLVLLELLLNTYDGHNPDGELYIVAFVQHIQQLSDEAMIRSRLTQWIDQLPADMKPVKSVTLTTASDVSEDRPSEDALKNPQAYFLITVEPPEITSQTEQFGVNGYLIFRLDNDPQFTQFQALTLQESVASKGGAVSEPHSRQQTRGVFCTLEQIENNLPDWLLQAQLASGHQCTELQNKFQLDYRPVYDLTVEFWLPFEHLATATDAWKIYSKPVRLKRRNLLVGQEYRVVVRSYDRFIDPDSLNELSRTWQELESLSKRFSDLVDVHSKLHHLDSWLAWTDLPPQAQENCLGLCLACAQCAQQDEQEKLFAWILENGIPITFWSRCTALTDTQKVALKDRMQDLIKVGHFSKLDVLLEDLKQARNSVEAGQLSLWLDEPNQLIELEKRILKRGRLRA